MADVLNMYDEFPLGGVLPYSGAVVDVPRGYAVCDGQELDRIRYKKLYRVISTTYGVGDGSTTFNLPDLRSRMLLGAGTGAGLSARSLNDTGGEEEHTLTIPEMAAHTHSYQRAVANTVEAGSNGDTLNAGATSGTAGSDQPHNNMPPYVVMNFIIKVEN